MSNLIKLLIVERQSLISQVLTGQVKIETIEDQILEINEKIQDMRIVIK